jgi:hypothetical protein
LRNEKPNLHPAILNPHWPEVLFSYSATKRNYSRPPLFETVSQPMFVIASDRRERGNLIIFNTLLDCFGRFPPSQLHYDTVSLAKGVGRGDLIFSCANREKKEGRQAGNGLHPTCRMKV